MNHIQGTAMELFIRKNADMETLSLNMVLSGLDAYGRQTASIHVHYENRGAIGER